MALTSRKVESILKRKSEFGSTTVPTCFERIVSSSKKVLNKAIEVGGTTLKDFYSADGSPGYFKIQLNVYGRDGKKCKKCEAEIVKVIINQRATFYCPKCQS